MKRRILNWMGIAIMAGAIAFSLIQLRVPVVRADGCPSNPFPECDCVLNWSTSTQYGTQTAWLCNYNCSCPQPGGGDFFYIEKEYSYVE